MADKVIPPQLSKPPIVASSATVVLDYFVHFAASRCQDAARWRELVGSWRSLLGENRDMIASGVTLSRP